MTKARLVLPVLAAMAAIAIAGCGGGGGSGSDLAGFASPGSLVYVEGELAPSGTLKANVDALAQKIAGVDNLGDYIAAKLEASAREDGEPFDFAKEVEPWLGERAAIAFQALKDGDLKDLVMAVQITDAAAARKFVDRQARRSTEPYREASYEGIEFEVGGSEDNAIGVVGDDLVMAEGEGGFEAAVDASHGESLADREEFDQAMSHAVDGSLADAYVNVGNLIKQSDSEIEPQALQALKTAGIDPSEAAAVASLVPGSDQVEIDVNADAGGEAPPAGDASQILSSLPGDAVAAFASTGFGERLGKALDELDENGIPGQVGPHELKKSVNQLGFDLGKIAASLEDAGLFVSGTGTDDLGGALVLTTADSSEVATAIKTIGLLVRQAGTPGVTALSGKANGFSVRSPELGPRPLVVATKGDRVAIGYGISKTLLGLSEGAGPTLADTPEYKAAAAALGDTPISGFVNGQRALALAGVLIPDSEKSGFRKALPYLKAIRYIAIGAGSEDDRATAKLIVGIGE
jgi:Protein of unknown function (DUF3352)